MSEPVTSLSVDGVPIQPSSWKLDITNRVSPIDQSMTARIDVMSLDFEHTFEATFDMQVGDRAWFEALAGLEALAAPYFTVEIVTDHNPWHRQATGCRARLRRLRAGVWWTFQRRVLRRDLVERTKITVPDCRWGSPPASEGMATERRYE